MFSIYMIMESVIKLFHFITSIFGRVLFSMWGAVCVVMEPRIPIVLICFLAVFMDCYTAWSLSRRVRDKFPGTNDGKFKSDHAGRVIITLIKVTALICLVAHMEDYIFTDLPVPLTKIVAGAICFWQIWSILENESSCNDAKWAKIAQRIMVDKTERHFDVDLHELKHEDDQNQETDLKNEPQNQEDNGKS